jgi:hypothetical protein
MNKQKIIHQKFEIEITGVTILISKNVAFKPKLFRRDKEGHYI